MSKRIKKQKKRNTKKFRKNLRKNPTNQSFVKEKIIDLPKVELGLTKIRYKNSLMDRLSDSMESTVRYNWKRYGVPFLKHNDNVDTHLELDNEIKYKSESFMKYGSKGNYYHLTSHLNYLKIMKEGLKSDDVKRMTSMGTSDRIWTVESKSPLIWNQIGYSQLGFGVKNLPIVVLKIDVEGINGDISSEEIGEYTSPLHTVIHQKHIDKRFIQPIGYFLSSRSHFYMMRNELGELKSSLYSTSLKMVG